MTPLQTIWTMIATLLQNYYEANNIINGYQNNYTLPQVDNFILIYQRNIFQNGYPLRGFNPEGQLKLLTAFNDWEYQIDLYGDNADTAASILYTYLDSSAASNFLLPYQMGIGKLYESKNLTKSNDRDRYMKRYMVLFTAMNINVVSVPSAGIALSDVTITYQQET